MKHLSCLRWVKALLSKEGKSRSLFTDVDENFWKEAVLVNTSQLNRI